jgi:hypothetical protein
VLWLILYRVFTGYDSPLPDLYLVSKYITMTKKTFALPVLFAVSAICLTLNTEAQVTELTRASFAVGIGYNHLFKTPKDYYLTTEAEPKLKIQDLNRGGIVVSSIISIRLAKVGLQKQQSNTTIRTRTVSLNTIEQVAAASNVWRAHGVPVVAGNVSTNKRASFTQSLCLNIGVNLAEVKGDNVAFNKSIDGGIGLGYSFNESVQLSFSLDVIRLRQMRDWIVDNYTDKPIPNGTSFFNALDQSNNNLFYNKTYGGLSLKCIFSFGNIK